jgi:hypothetical protein
MGQIERRDAAPSIHRLVDEFTEEESDMTKRSATTYVKVAGVEVSTAHWIEGLRVPSNRTFEDFSPIDGSHLANVSAGGVEEANAAVAAARRAFVACPS